MKAASRTKIILSQQQRQAAETIFGPGLAKTIIDQAQARIDDQAKQLAQAAKPKTIKLSLAGNYFGLNGTSGKEAMITRYFGGEQQ